MIGHRGCQRARHREHARGVRARPQRRRRRRRAGRAPVRQRRGGGLPRRRSRAARGATRQNREHPLPGAAPGFPPGGERIPLLAEVLAVTGPDAAGQRRAEGVGARPQGIVALVERVAAVVADAGAGGARAGVVVQPLRRRGLDAAGPDRRRRAAVRARGAAAAAAGLGGALAATRRRFTRRSSCARPRRVAGWRRRGYMVNVWTVDGPEAVRACRDLGVDARDHERSGRPELARCVSAK